MSAIPQPSEGETVRRAEVTRIADQLHRGFAGDAWHGPALTELVGSVSSDQAIAKPIPDAHSIWELVLHITAWKKIIHRRLMGEPAQLSAAEDWPPAAATGPIAWNNALRELHAAQKQLRDDLAAMDDSQLHERMAGSDQTVYVVLHGLTQHDIYHAGQIAVLKKAFGRK